MPADIREADDHARAAPMTWYRRMPVAAFVFVELFALVLWLGIGRREWFYGDDWAFVAKRKAGDLGDALRPANGHWATLPILTYRFLYSLFGLRSYFPYRLVVVVLYVTAAALLLVIMRRAGVHPWIATAAASLFALFGAGWWNIIRPFQMTFTGALVLGLGYLVLADHDGPFDRRDWLGVVAGLLALMTSGVGAVMVIVVGIAVLLRRGWRLAVLHAAPLGALYLTWFLIIGHKGGKSQPGPTAGGITGFVASGFSGTLEALGPVKWLAGLFAVVLVAGLSIAIIQRQESSQREQLAAPIALLIGTVVWLLVVSVGRAFLGAAYAHESRIISLVGAMLLPALAVAADALVRLRRSLLPIAVALFFAGVPHNIQEASTAQRALNPLYAGTRSVVLTVPRDPIAADVPSSFEPDPLTASGLTIGWLRGAVARHKIPGPETLTTQELAAANFRLSFYQEKSIGRTTNCSTLNRPLIIKVRIGEVIDMSAGLILLEPDHGYLYPGLVFGPARGRYIEVIHHVGPVRVSAYNPNEKAGSIPREGWPRICIG